MAAIDLVRRSYVAFERGDIAGVLADMHPNIEWHQAQGLPHGGLYHGVDEVKRNIFDPLHGSWWEEFSAPPDEFLDAGDQVVVIGRYRGVAKGTRKTLDVPFVHIWTVEGEKAIRFRQYLDTAGWIEALAEI
jgi:ketosteroid isomerase-like protein